MGADFIHSICPLPDITDEVKQKISRNIANLSDKTICNLLDMVNYHWEADLQERLDNGIKEKHLFDINDIQRVFVLEMLKERLEEALEEVVYNSDRRDVGHLFLEHKWWIISGGLSWGGAPTEAMQYIDLIEESGILGGLN